MNTKKTAPSEPKTTSLKQELAGDSGSLNIGKYIFTSKLNVSYRQIYGDFYSVIGILVFWVITINLFLIFKFKRVSFLPLIYNQTIVTLLLSSSNPSAESKSFTGILLNLSFSFDFLTPDILNKKLGWANGSTQMQNMHFYCNSTFLNYKCAIVFAIFGTIIYQLLRVVVKKLNKEQDSESKPKWFPVFL